MTAHGPRSRPAADDDPVGRVLSRLATGEPVREQLAGGGRVHIDRPLPFLCVHEADAEGDSAAADTAAANAAYLLAPDLAAQAGLIGAIAEAMQARFGAFAVLEVSELLQDRLRPADSPHLPPFEIFVASTGDPSSRAAADAFTEAVRSVEVKYRSPRVFREALAEGEPPWAAGVPAGTGLLRLRFAPIYRGPQGGPDYAELRERVVANVYDAVLRAFAAFVESAGGGRVASHRALGRRVFIETVRRVDEQLDAIAGAFDFLLAVTPINSEAAWHEFRGSGFSAVPRLLYRPLAVEVDRLKRGLFEISFRHLEDPVLHGLFREKRQELDLQLTLLQLRGSRRFMEASRLLYGPVAPELRSLAEDILARLPGEPAGPRRRDAERPADSRELAAAARRMVAGYGARHGGFAAEIEVRDDLPPGVMVSGPCLMIGRATVTAHARVDALLHHEVGVHLLTYFAGDAQGLRLFRSGLAGYEETQEGLAVFAEYLAGGLTAARMRVIAGRVVACAAMLEGAEFPETYRLLTDGHGFAPAMAFNLALRLYRSGGLTKDAIYLRGLRDILAHLAAGRSLTPFWAGKIAFAHLTVIGELIDRGLLKAPAIAPAFLDAPGAERRLAAARAGLSPVDLVSA